MRSKPKPKVMRPKKKRYTLIQLITMTAIVIALGAIVVPSLIGQQKSNVDNRVQEDIKVVAQSIDSALASKSYVVPVEGSTDSKIAIDGVAVSSFELNPATRIEVSGISTDYTITGTDEKGKQSADGITYDSQTRSFEN